MPASLPLPSTEAADHSARLAEFIQRDIAAHCDAGTPCNAETHCNTETHSNAETKRGWISFARYMELALYAPGLGYYTAGAHKFGEAGDFVTAPELSPLFGRTLARQAVEIMALSAPHILELGAGSGKLAADMLTELEKLGALPGSYMILEVSADLRARQQNLLRERLPHLLDRLRWLDELPESFSGAIIANEVLDALPVHLVHWRDGTISERGVAISNNGLSDNGFIWQERVIGDANLLSAAQQINAPDGYVSEISLAARGLVNSLASCLEQGVILFIDYGFGAREYYHPQRSSGTLMCHYRHHAHDDPFFLPGLQDITAHVNFTDIAETGIDAGLELLGYTSQAFFLINCGIAELLRDTSPENLRAYLPLSAQLQKLTSPAEMGELFKVIALGKKTSSDFTGGTSKPLSGFTRGDLTRSL